MRERTRAQVSVEFLAITGIAMLILVSSTFLLFQYARGAAEQSAYRQVHDIGEEIIEQARNVYVFGEDTFVTVHASLPAEVIAVYTVNDGTVNNSLVFEVATTKGIVTLPIFSDVAITGIIQNPVGGLRYAVNQSDHVVHPGSTKYRITSRGYIVEIEQIA